MRYRFVKYHSVVLILATLIIHTPFIMRSFQSKRISTGEFAAIKVIKLEQGDDFGIIQHEILMMKVIKLPTVPQTQIDECW